MKSNNLENTIQRVARIFRAARKLRGLNQQEVSLAMGVSQGTISKFESGSLIPDMNQWYQFCQIVSIDPDFSFHTGFINLKNKSGQVRSKLKMGKNQSLVQISTNEIIPIINFLSRSEHKKAFEHHLATNSIDKDLFAVLNLNVPISILNCIIGFIEDFNIEVSNFIQDVANCVVVDSNFKKVDNLKKLVTSMNDRSSLFHFNFEYLPQGQKVEVNLSDKLRYSSKDEKPILYLLDLKSKAIIHHCEKEFGIALLDSQKNITEKHLALQFQS